MARFLRMDGAYSVHAAHEGGRREGDAALAAGWSVARFQQMAGGDRDHAAHEVRRTARAWALVAGSGLAMPRAVGHISRAECV